ncbi:MAG: hypothetical protein IKH75_01160 [Ruminococcus sp.]|nr:hypothetical protein [Ruminococcus sp.]
MLHIWDAIEADFLRDYRIALVEQLDTMSWRLFLVLLNNLNPYGAVSAAIRAKEDKNNDDNETNDEQDKKDADKFFTSMLSV